MRFVILFPHSVCIRWQLYSFAILLQQVKRNSAGLSLQTHGRTGPGTPQKVVEGSWTKTKLWLRRKQGLIHMEKISSPLAEFVKVLYTSQVLITVKAVPTRKASVRCVAKRFWILKTTSRLPSRLLKIPTLRLYLCFSFSSVTRMSISQNDLFEDEWFSLKQGRWSVLICLLSWSCEWSFCLRWLFSLWAFYWTR